jgi:hypothetical protein
MVLLQACQIATNLKNCINSDNISDAEDELTGFLVSGGEYNATSDDTTINNDDSIERPGVINVGQRDGNDIWEICLPVIQNFIKFSVMPRCKALVGSEPETRLH